jgi:protein-S-isoprenylcysteine O-methyltransferase Ste14
VATIAGYWLLAAWVLFFFPFLAFAPLRQKRPSIVVTGPSRLGILLEAVAIGFAWPQRLDGPPDDLRAAASMLVAALGVAAAFASVRHLGRQFRVQAGLYEDHQLVRTGPYGVVRHPIYAGLFAMLGATLLLRSTWPWWPLSIVVYLIGTEVRVRTEDKLLAGRFGPAFEEYRRDVKAYVPFVR